ncbi:MAG: alpha-methylacyl-CoA racemase [Bradyrhizobium sp.]|jgi:alpha-methylacyl-CoA racemase
MSFTPDHQLSTTKPGPLTGITIIELAAIGPVPFATRCLQQMGAQIIVVDSPVNRGLGLPLAANFDYLSSDKQHVTIDLKADDGPARLMDLLRQADVLIEGFRPGTLERLSLSPEVIHARLPALVIGRCSGWGSQSVRAATAGHDINYLALSGALAAIGPASKPIPPLNLIGDFGGAGMHLVSGILAALFSRSKDGNGTVVETSIYQGTTSLMTMLYGLADAGQWRPEREANILDGGAPYYCCYQTSDAGWMAVGAIERKFFTAFIRQIGADEIDQDRQNDQSYWPEMRQLIAKKMNQRTRHEWDLVFRESDCCCTPVLGMDEARTHETTLSLFDGAVPKDPISFIANRDSANGP